MKDHTAREHIADLIEDQGMVLLSMFYNDCLGYSSTEEEVKGLGVKDFAKARIN